MKRRVDRVLLGVGCRPPARVRGLKPQRLRRLPARRHIAPRAGSWIETRTCSLHAQVKAEEVLWIGGFGSADVAAGRPADAGTIYSICSISKLFTSVAVMRERDAGKLSLDDAVGKRLSWFRLKRAEGEGDVTIEGLLTHASGLPRESDYPYWSPPDFRFPTRVKSPTAA